MGLDSAINYKTAREMKQALAQPEWHRYSNTPKPSSKDPKTRSKTFIDLLSGENPGKQIVRAGA